MDFTNEEFDYDIFDEGFFDDDIFDEGFFDDDVFGITV